MIFNNEILNKAIRDLITASNATNPVLAIRAEQNAPLPTAKPFATVRISLLPPIGWAEISNVNNVTTDIDQTIAQKTMVRASINYYRNSQENYATPGMLSALDEAVNLRLYMQTDAARTAFNAAGIGLNKLSQIRNLSFLEEKTWEERAQCDLDFNIITSRTDLINEIKSVLISGIYEEHTNQQQISVTVDADTCP